jgi:hypothetical protein
MKRTYDEETRILEHRKKQPTETYDALQQDILNMVGCVYADANDAFRVREARDCFLRALPAHIQAAVAGGCPENIQEATRAVSMISKWVDPKQLGPTT